MPIFALRNAALPATSFCHRTRWCRISQTVNGTLTTYVLDVATPLTMVLSETSNGVTLHYWQGLDLLAQSDGSQTEYLAYDGLGSVRQVTPDPSGRPAYPRQSGGWFFIRHATPTG